jgi:hypothetical protein
MKKKIAETYAQLRHNVSLTGISGVWRDLGNQKQYRATNGAILNWWESTGTVTFQGRGLAANKLEAALAAAICTGQTKIAQKALKGRPLQDPQDYTAQASNETSRSVGVLRKAKITIKPLSPDLSGNLYLQRHTFEAIAKQFGTTDQTEVICNIAAWIYSDEGGSDLTVELSPSYKRI